MLVQNQTGLRHKKWDKSGVVVEVLEFHQYRIRMDGTGRPTLRNRRFLRPITPYQTPVMSSNTHQTDDLPDDSPEQPPVEQHQGVVQPQPEAAAETEMRRSDRIRKINTAQGNPLNSFTMQYQEKAISILRGGEEIVGYESIVYTLFQIIINKCLWLCVSLIMIGRSVPIMISKK